MKRMIVTALALGGCVSDLAVGMSTKLISGEDAATPGEDAGRELDASTPWLDAGEGPVVYGDDAALPAADAGDDAASYPKLCSISSCIQFLVVARCDGGSEQVCARPAADLACEWLCMEGP